MKPRTITIRQQAQPQQYESLTVEVMADVEEGEDLAVALATLGARVRRSLAAQLILARRPESDWLDEPYEGEPGEP